MKHTRPILTAVLVSGSLMLGCADVASAARKGPTLPAPDFTKGRRDGKPNPHVERIDKTIATIESGDPSPTVLDLKDFSAR